MCIYVFKGVFEIITAVPTKSDIFWDVPQCHLVKIREVSSEHNDSITRVEE